MADRERLERALANAHKAGDVESARKLAAALKPTEIADRSEFSFGEMMGNVPGSAYDLANSLYTAVTNPVETGKGVGKLALGGAQKLRDVVDPYIPMTPIENDYRPHAEAFGGAMVDRYGGKEEILNTLEKDPIGLLADAATIGMPLKSSGLLNPFTALKNVVKAAAKVSTPKGLPGRLYEKTAKFGTTLDDTERARLVETALANQIPLTAKGTQKLGGLIDKFNTKIDDLITSSTGTVPRGSVYRHLKELRREVGGMNLDAPKDLKAIDDIIGSFEEYAKTNLPAQLTARDLQTFKVNLYKRINWDAKRMTGTPIKEATQKSVARGAKEGVEKLAPGTKETNAALSDLYDLQPHLQRSVNRLDNRRLIPLTAPMEIGAGAGVGSLLGGPAGGAVGAGIGGLTALLGHPRITPQLALALRRLQEQQLMGILTQEGSLAKGLLLGAQANNANQRSSR